MTLRINPNSVIMVHEPLNQAPFSPVWIAPGPRPRVPHFSFPPPGQRSLGSFCLEPCPRTCPTIFFLLFQASAFLRPSFLKLTPAPTSFGIILRMHELFLHFLSSTMTTQFLAESDLPVLPNPRVLGRQDARNTLVSAAADIYPLLCITEKTNAHLAYSTGKGACCL